MIYENSNKNTGIPNKLYAELNNDGLLISREDNSNLIEEVKTFKEKIGMFDNDEIDNDPNLFDALQKIMNKSLSIEYNSPHSIKSFINFFGSLYIDNERIINAFMKINALNHGTSNSKLIKFLNIIKKHFPNIFIEFQIQSNKLAIETNADIKVVPNIFFYENKNINNNDLKTNLYTYHDNLVWKRIMDKINIKNENILSYIDQYKTTKNKSHFRELENIINEGLEKISDEFNMIYRQKYTFKCIIESSGEIELNIYNEQNKALSLDFQSTGFKWFFNLYFSNILSDNINVGDIIVIDEPGVHLHVSGQIELRNFLKSFAKNNNITIIITTHSPFLIDIDNLDELRVVASKNGIAKICDKFHYIDGNDTDVIEELKKSLTVNQNILFSEQSKIIFVEGINDYNYLTKFKNLKIFDQKYQNLYFFPINGIGKNINEENVSKILKKIKKIWNNKSFLLVDSDQLGLKFKEKYSMDENIIVTLNEAFHNDDKSKIKEIESLFECENNSEIMELIKNKSFAKSSLFKNHYPEEKIPPTIVENFGSVAIFGETLKISFFGNALHIN